MSCARGSTVPKEMTSAHQRRRTLDFRKKTAVDRLIATSTLDPGLARQRRSASAKHLAREILRRVDASMSCEVSHKQLASALGCSVDTIEKAQAILVANGWLHVERRWISGHQTCSRYHLLKSDDDAGSMFAPTRAPVRRSAADYRSSTKSTMSGRRMFEPPNVLVMTNSGWDQLQNLMSAAQ